LGGNWNILKTTFVRSSAAAGCKNRSNAASVKAGRKKFFNENGPGR
jgi:hypothetical protein